MDYIYNKMSVKYVRVNSSSMGLVKSHCRGYQYGMLHIRGAQIFQKSSNQFQILDG